MSVAIVDRALAFALPSQAVERLSLHLQINATTHAELEQEKERPAAAVFSWTSQHHNIRVFCDGRQKRTHQQTREQR